MTEKIITKGLDQHFLETKDGNLQQVTTAEAKAILGFDNVEAVPLGGQVIADKYFETDGGNITKIIPADN